MTKILIIDDEINNCLLLEDILEDLEEDIKIWTTQSGEEGLELIKKLKPHIVLIDQILPEISGIKICKVIKDELGMKDIKFILITALDIIIDLEIEKIFVDDFISKPYRSQNVLEKVMRLID